MLYLEISGKDAENTSSHVKVSIMLSLNYAEGTTSTKMNTSKPIKKLNWDKLDKSAYVRSLERELAKAEHTEPASVEQRLNRLTTVIHKATGTGPRSAVGNVSGYRCVSDCRSRGPEFDPGPVPYFRGY